MDDEARRRRIWRKIARVDREIRKYEEAKEYVQEARYEVGQKKEDWQSDFDRLNGNSELLAVEKRDIFEGGMAQKLGANYVAEEVQNINRGISEAEGFKCSLQNQVSRIEQKIQQLEAERQSLYNQL